jgi:hypothetical protein
MTAAMLLPEPISDDDFPDEQCAYRPGLDAQQAGDRRASKVVPGAPGI